MPFSLTSLSSLPKLPIIQHKPNQCPHLFTAEFGDREKAGTENKQIKLFLYYRFGRKKGVVIPMLLAAVGAAGSVLLTTDDESNKGTVSMWSPRCPCGQRISFLCPESKLPYPVNHALRILSTWRLSMTEYPIIENLTETVNDLFKFLSDT